MGGATVGSDDETTVKGPGYLFGNAASQPEVAVTDPRAFLAAATFPLRS